MGKLKCSILLLTFAWLFSNCSPANVCTPGEKKCEGGKALVCKLDGSTWETTNCASDETCENGECKRFACKVGTKKCEGKKALVCRTDRLGWETTNCASDETCENGECKKTSKEWGKEGQPCYPNKTCNVGLVCVNDTCNKSLGCKQGEKKCDGNTAVVCGAGEIWERTNCASDEKCDSGKCVKSSDYHPSYSSCSTDKDCPSGKECDLNRKECAIKPGTEKYKKAFGGGGSYCFPFSKDVAITCAKGPYSNCSPDGTGQHYGTDYGSTCGTDVYSPVDGRVIKVVKGESDTSNRGCGCFGNYVKILSNEETITLAHLQKDQVFVNEGDIVLMGQKIAKSGTSGDSTGCHLHLEIRDKNGNAKDPTNGGFQSGCYGSDKITSNSYSCALERQDPKNSKPVEVPTGTVLTVTFVFRNNSGFQWVCDNGPGGQGVSHPRHVELFVAEGISGALATNDSPFFHSTWENRRRIGCFDLTVHTGKYVSPTQGAIFRFKVKVPAGENRLWVVPTLAGKSFSNKCFGGAFIWVKGTNGSPGCSSGEKESKDCKNCGKQTRMCNNGQWSDWGACTGQGVCTSGTTQACGVGGSQTCNSSCQWGQCTGQTCVGSSSQSCGNCGTQTRTCNNGQWSNWGVCTNQGTCKPATTQRCGTRGTQTCANTCQWGQCLDCTGPTSQVCGNCGTQTRTCNNGQWSNWGICTGQCNSGSVCVGGQCVSKPSTPCCLSASYQSSSRRNYIQWGRVNDAKQYVVYWGTSSNVTTSSNQLTPTTTTNYGHTGVSGGYTYYYRVAARNSAGDSPLSATRSVTIPAPPPSIPTGVNVQFTTSPRWNYVKWNYVSGATKYFVYWGTSSNVTKLSNKMGPTSTNDFGHSGVQSGSTYYYRVSAFNLSGESGLSSTVSVRVP